MHIFELEIIKNQYCILINILNLQHNMITERLLTFLLYPPDNTPTLRTRRMRGIPVEDGGRICALVCLLGDVLYQVTIRHCWRHLHKPAQCIREHTDQYYNTGNFPTDTVGFRECCILRDHTSEC